MRPRRHPRLAACRHRCPVARARAVLAVPALYLLADERRSAVGASRARLIRALPPDASLVEFDSGHTIHRDRFDAYIAEVLRWLGEPG